MALTIYHAQFARSVRLRWLCLEMGLGHEIKHIPNKPEYLTSDEYRTLNPSGKIPALDDDGLILFESVAIMEYLLATKPGGKHLVPAQDDALFGPYLQWLHFGEAGMGMYVTMALGHNRLLPEERRIPMIAKWAEKESQRCFEVLAGPLKANDYLLPFGFSAADISVAYMLLLAKFAGIFDEAPDSVKAYFKRCAEREAWKTATAD